MGGGARGGGSGIPSPATSGVGFSGAGFRNVRVCINWRKALAKTLFSNEKRRKLKEATCENGQRRHGASGVGFGIINNYLVTR